MRRFALRCFTGLAMLSCSVLASAQAAPPAWTTVVNNGTTMPGSTSLFNSYNQPSVNAYGTVVFRARSKGGDNTQPIHGIYLRNMSRGSAVERVFDKTSLVPDPNNNEATFIEFPAFPRIDIDSDTLATRGRSQPVLTYIVDGEQSKAGTSGIYVERRNKSLTAASQLGVVPDYSYFEVPYAPAGTKFDVFPGAPTVSEDLVVFKGNYTVDDISKTGIYYRNIAPNAKSSPVERIADSSTLIPGQPEGGTTTFGATAPPSAALGKVVFTGWDNEETPTVGGIYLASISPDPPLTTIAYIGEQVPGEAAGTTFTNFGENLAFDGRYIAFWATWGSEMNKITLTCPTDGNKDLIAFCNQLYPSGKTKVNEPVHQGIFVYDTGTEPGTLVALAKSPNDFTDFLYWVFSGKPPAIDETSAHGKAPSTGSSESTDGEPARWRSAAFVAVSVAQDADFRAIFKGQRGSLDGIYAAQWPAPSDAPAITTLLDTTTPGTAVDLKAPPGSTVVSLGLEREGYRAGRLVITASMLDPTTTESWAGIYYRILP